MRFAQDDIPGQYSIGAYETGKIIVNQRSIDCPIVITADILIPDWAPSFEELKPGHLDVVRDLQPEVVILGTGAALRFPAAACTAPFLLQGIGVEVMDTAAACRTYNILLAEGRRVAAALFML